MSAASYLKTLRRIPDDIVLSIATRDLDVYSCNDCICGWAAREVIGAAAGADADSVSAYQPDPRYSDRLVSPRQTCRQVFGGEQGEWTRLFCAAACPEDTDVVEEAFVTRVMEAAGVA